MNQDNLKRLVILLMLVGVVALLGIVTLIFEDSKKTPVASGGAYAFTSEIQFLEDGSFLVSEVIPVLFNEQMKAKGIQRNLRQGYRDRDGKYVKFDYELISAFKNSEPENFFLIDLAPFYRIRVGRAEEPSLPAGNYRYELMYRVKNGLRILHDQEKIVWFVIGDWPIVVPRPILKVFLPKGVTEDKFKVRLSKISFSERGEEQRVIIKPSEYKMVARSVASDPQIAEEGETSLTFNFNFDLAPAQILHVEFSWPRRSGVRVTPQILPEAQEAPVNPVPKVESPALDEDLPKPPLGMVVGGFGI